MRKARNLLLCSAVVVGLLAVSIHIRSASHREAPIVALDRAADITDFFAFVSYDDPSKVTFILNVDPLLEPSNGPNYFPFDPGILYEIKIDNNQNAAEDVTLQFRFQTEFSQPHSYTGYFGIEGNVVTPSNSPPPVAPGVALPPPITTLSPSTFGLIQRQFYTVTMIRSGQSTSLDGGRQLLAVPSNVGPRTMPNYEAFARQGIYDLGGGVRVFAGTVDDPFYIDLGAAFDSLNFRAGAFPSGIPGVLTDVQDADDASNFAPDTVSGFNVNTIAIELPIATITQGGARHAATDPRAVIGAWGTTSRPRITVRRSVTDPELSSTNFQQVQRMANPLINELLVGIGSKDTWSISAPRDDAQFASTLLDPLFPRVINAAYRGAVEIPAPPRNDLLPLVTYAPPIAPAGTTAGPVADLLRLNTGVPPASAATRKRLGVLGGDLAGFPNGRRVSDDVTDIAARVVVGVLNPAFNKLPNNRIGDGVNTNDRPYQDTFPYVAFAHSGRDRRHIDPGEAGCAGRATCP